MNEEKNVPYIVFESEMARLERIVKRFSILAFLAILMLVLTNGLWIYREMQYEDILVTQDVETGTGNAFVSGTGDIYGKSTPNSKNTQKEDR